MAEKSTRKKQSKVSTEIGVLDSEPMESGFKVMKFPTMNVLYALVCMKMTCL